MTHETTIHALLASARPALDEQARADERRAARVAWVHETMAALRAAQKRVDDAWTRIFDALPDDLDEEDLEAIPEPPEQAELDRILTEIKAVCDHDKWPRHLHWSL
jgi:hypothetical protein